MAAFSGIANGSMILFTILLVSAIFFGRLFCSTICPAGAAGDYLGEVKTNKVKNGWFNGIKMIFWVPWMAGIISGIIVSGGIQGINFTYMTDSGISVASKGAYIIYLGVLFLVMIVNLLVGKRAFCHYGCWMAPFMIIGIKIRQLLKLPGLTLDANNSCISCSKCSKTCPMSLDVQGMVAEKKMTNTECILCGQCVKTCPKDTICYSFKRG
jgi:polyferredoxin